jgi:hypothetical protein
MEQDPWDGRPQEHKRATYYWLARRAASPPRQFPFAGNPAPRHGALARRRTTT